MMKKKKLLLAAALMLVACGLLTAPAVADIYLEDWIVNIDGDVYYPGDTFPAAVDDSGFDFNTGLGTLAVSIDAPGDHFVGLFI